MTRRGFIERLLLAFGYLALGNPKLTVEELRPATIHMSELDRFMSEEAQRIAATILDRITRPSPFLTLLNEKSSIPFPHSAGGSGAVRVVSSMRV